MPRGNLETIHHRALVLAQLRKQLDWYELSSSSPIVQVQVGLLSYVYIVDLTRNTDEGLDPKRLLFLTNVACNRFFGF